MFVCLFVWVLMLVADCCVRLVGLVIVVVLCLVGCWCFRGFGLFGCLVVVRWGVCC